MSKQLLHTCDSGVIVVALDDRAFVLVDDARTSSARAFELTDDDKHDADDPASGSTNGQQQKCLQKKKNDREIQAVCCEKIGTKRWFAGRSPAPMCGDVVVRFRLTISLPSTRQRTSAAHLYYKVSREDKTLSLYEVGEGDEGRKFLPTTTHKMPKRARCLAFCNIPSSSPGGVECHAVLVGDLSGDSLAFSLVQGIPPRLLLGHTASVLTGLKVVASTVDKLRGKLLLTSDRDEKIRISCFPETHITKEYLLGHDLFISSMDAVSKGVADGKAWCVSGSGDGTVRLWDYDSFKQIGMVPIVLKPSEKNDDVKEAEPSDGKGIDSHDCDGGAGEGTEEDCDDHRIAVPLAVGLSPHADRIVVARDGINSIDIHPIPSPSTASPLLPSFVSLHKRQTLDCKSQPLALGWLPDGSVLVLVRDPEFLLHFKPCCSGSGDEYENVSPTSALCTALRNAVDRRISMPESTLERDSYGKLVLQKIRLLEDDEQDGNSNERKGGGLHWQDAGRKVTAKMAEQRRRKRKREQAKGKGTAEEAKKASE
ncbi:hypothetical protein THAOC_07147 [Thalassiosira oceanica]|uniref:WD repeat-containing protein 4 homolog n=1 Tax=Thalassiosira oceanica TaxID=159749 RepID=K0SYA4_THAOC|nr:hypothetical protein THAOC_07147 [Thalassiosira oceanica]|eukprot:EJK71418.1 hypothetical protein THAOC_07147 [Thalassiosira oceanica]